MTMIFEVVRDALIELMGASQGAEWNTIGFLERDESAKEINVKRTAQVYYNGGDFPKGSSSLSGPVQHDMKFHIMLSVAEKSKGDQAALDAATTEAEYMAASASFTRSEFEADRNMDDFISKIFLLLMAPQNRNLGLDVNLYPKIGNRWIPAVRKEAIKTSGGFCTMRSMITLGGLIPEDLAGIDTAGLPEYEQVPYSGDIEIKDNVKQSGNLDAGTPIVNELP